MLRGPAGERLSILDVVLRRQARRRRARQAGLTALLLLAVFAVLWPGPTARAPSTGGRALPWVAGTGAVGGYVQPCDGLGVPLHTATGARLFSAAAVVEALPGQEHLKPAGHGTYRLVLPAAVAARDRVSQNQPFRLDDLAPGRYVIMAQYAPGNGRTAQEVTVAPGRVDEVDLPDTCS